MHLLKLSVVHRDSPQSLSVSRSALNSLLEVCPLALVALQSETLNRKDFLGVVAPASSVVSKSHLVASLVAQNMPRNLGFYEYDNSSFNEPPNCFRG